MEGLLIWGSYDGQAGAAAITLDTPNEEPFVKNLYNGLKKSGLPAYAIPRLVRITPEYVSWLSPDRVVILTAQN